MWYVYIVAYELWQEPFQGVLKQATIAGLYHCGKRLVFIGSSKVFVNFAVFLELAAVVFVFACSSCEALLMSLLDVVQCCSLLGLLSTVYFCISGVFGFVPQLRGSHFYFLLVALSDSTFAMLQLRSWSSCTCSYKRMTQATWWSWF